MRENRSSGSVEGVVSNHDSYSDYNYRSRRNIVQRCLVKSRGIRFGSLNEFSACGRRKGEFRIRDTGRR